MSCYKTNIHIIRILAFALAITMIYGRAICQHSFRSSKAEIKPKEMLGILMAGWKNNTQKIDTLQLKCTLTASADLYAECRDLDGKTYDGHTANIQLWKNNNSIRIDSVYDRMFDIIHGEVKYNLPFGDYIEQKRTHDKNMLVRKYGTTVTTGRYLCLKDKDVDKSYRYLQEGKELIISDASTMPQGNLECLWVSNNMFYLQKTFSRFAKGIMKNSDVSFEVKETGSGVYSIHVYSLEKNSDNQYRHEARLQIDANRGYAVTDFEIFLYNQPEFKGEYQYTESDGTWVLTSFKAMYYNKGAIERTVTLESDIKSLKINQPIDPKTFTVEALNIAKGSLVIDKTDGKRYLYNDVPMHLKVALHEAQRDLEKLPEDMEHLTTKNDTVPRSSYQERHEQPVPLETEPHSGDIYSTLDNKFIIWVMVSGGVFISVVAITISYYLRRKKKGGRA